MLLDSNIFLEAALAQEHGEACRVLLERLKDGSIKAGITDFHVDSIVLVSEKYGKSWRDISLFLASLLRYRGLTVHSLGLVARIRATTIMRDYGLDFDDALLVQALKDLSMDTVVSYDEHFDKVSWLTRRTPEQML